MIFGARYKDRDYFPAFQFRDGHPKPIVGRIVSVHHLVRREKLVPVLLARRRHAWLDADATPSSAMDSNEEAVIEAAEHANDRISD